jgi:hypothetical protein
MGLLPSPNHATCFSSFLHDRHWQSRKVTSADLQFSTFSEIWVTVALHVDIMHRCYHDSGITRTLHLCMWLLIQVVNVELPTSHTSPCLLSVRTSHGIRSSKGAFTSLWCLPSMSGRRSQSRYIVLYLIFFSFRSWEPRISSDNFVVCLVQLDGRRFVIDW